MMMTDFTSQKSILVVEDDANVLDLTALLLEKEGYQVLKAAAGRQALDLAAEKLPDMILLDVVLPDMDGKDVCRALRRDPKTSEIVIMLVSALQVSAEDQVLGLETGADDYLVRPIGNKELAARVKAMFRLNDLVKTRTAQLQAQIQERRQAEAALRESEQNYKTLFNTCGDGILIAELSTLKFVEANPAICQMLRYSREELLAKSIPDIHPGEAMDAVMTAFKQQAAGKRQLAENIPCLTKDGRTVYFDINGVKVTLMGRDCNAGFFRDVTGKRKMAEQILQSQKIEAIGTLAGGIAHEFNNLLGVIMGNVSYALAQSDKSQELFEVLTDALEGTRQAQHLAHQLITFAKGGTPIKQTLEIPKAVQGAAAFALKGTDSRCTFEFAPDLWRIDADPGQINQVFTNLFLNASQAMPEGGVISVKAENCPMNAENSLLPSTGPYVGITIADHGVGIAEKHIARIFDPYFSTKYKGSGMGLATAHSIIQKHGGHISAKSWLGQGAVFQIYLPAVGEDTQTPEERQPMVPDQGRGRILIMDDQEPILKMISRMLKRMGYESTCVTDGAQAVACYREALESGAPFELVILDLTVPGGMGGVRTLPELKKIDPNVKAVVSSGYSNDPVMASYQEYGFCGVVPKPYTKDQLAAVLQNIRRAKDESI